MLSVNDHPAYTYLSRMFNGVVVCGSSPPGVVLRTWCLTDDLFNFVEDTVEAFFRRSLSEYKMYALYHTMMM